MDEEERIPANWAKVAAWTFGVWAMMVPISASIIGYYQRQTIERQDAIRSEITALRLLVVEDSRTLHERQDSNTERIQDHEFRLRDLEGKPVQPERSK